VLYEPISSIISQQTAGTRAIAPFVSGIAVV